MPIVAKGLIPAASFFAGCSLSERRNGIISFYLVCCLRARWLAPPPKPINDWRCCVCLRGFGGLPRPAPLNKSFRWFWRHAPSSNRVPSSPFLQSEARQRLKLLHVLVLAGSVACPARGRRRITHVRSSAHSCPVRLFCPETPSLLLGTLLLDGACRQNQQKDLFKGAGRGKPPNPRKQTQQRQ